MPGLQIECARTSPSANNAQPDFQQPEALRMQKNTCWGRLLQSTNHKLCHLGTRWPGSCCKRRLKYLDNTRYKDRNIGLITHFSKGQTHFLILPSYGTGAIWWGNTNYVQMIMNHLRKSFSSSFLISAKCACWWFFQQLSEASTQLSASVCHVQMHLNHIRPLCPFFGEVVGISKM